jgi:formate/nitrite transporter FocA (FNT family)
MAVQQQPRAEDRPAPKVETVPEDPTEREPRDIADRASGIGRDRLKRTPLDMFVTALIGGSEVSMGGLAAMAVAGAILHTFPSVGFPLALVLGGLAFPIGFLFVILGRSELFTENFLIPVVAVFNRERPVGSLLSLWALSWLGNIVGCALTALLLSAPEVIGDPIREGYRAYAEHKLALAPLGVFGSAILAGGVMTILTWLLLSVQDSVGKILIIFGVAFLLCAANLSHSVISAAFLFTGFAAAHHSLGDVLVFVAISTVGNLIGGTVLVTLFRLVQAKESKQAAE